MPFLTVRLMPPGVKVVQTPGLLMTSIVASNLIRWRQGLPEKIGGWSLMAQNALPGPVRALWAWSDINQFNNYHLAAAGDQGVYIITGSNPEGGPLINAPQNATPQYLTSTPPISFSTVAGTSNVSIIDPAGNVTPYMTITLETPVAVGGTVLWPGNYPIVSVQSTTQYTIATNVVFPITSTNAGVTATFTTVQGSPAVTVSLPNHGLTPGKTFAVGIPTLVGATGNALLLSGFYTVLSVTAPQTAVASAAFTTGSTFNVTTGPTGVPAGTVITDVNSGLMVGTVASIAGAAITIQQANPLHPVANGDTVSFASSSFTFDAQNLAPTAGTATYGNLPAGDTQIVYWVVFGQQPPGGGWGDAAWGQGLAPAATPPQNASWGEASAPPPLVGTPVRPLYSDDWTMENFGSDLIINPQDQPLFYWAPTSGVLGSQQLWQGPTVVHGFFIAMPQQMIVTYGASVQNVQDPMLVAWCDAGDLTDWTASASNEAGTFRLSRGSKIVAGIQGPQQAMLWTDVGLWLMTFIGYPDVWGFGEIARGCGLFAKKGVGVLGPMVFWLSKDNFWMYVNGGCQVIPCDVWDVVFKNMNLGYGANGEPFTEHIRCIVNTGFNEVAWHYPSLASVNGENDMYVKYNVTEQAWDYGWLGATAGLDQNVFGHPLFALMGSSGASYVMQAEMTNDANGAPIPYSFQTGFFQISEGEDKVYVDYCIPDFKWARWNRPQTVSAKVQLTFFTSDWPDDPNEQTGVYGPYTVTNASDAIDPRMRGRYFSMQVAGDDLGSFVRLGGIKLRYAPDGRN